jgi:hypothetical protein
VATVAAWTSKPSLKQNRDPNWGPGFDLKEQSLVGCLNVSILLGGDAQRMPYLPQALL